MTALGRAQRILRANATTGAAGPLLSLLPGGPSASQIAAGVLYTQRGALVTCTRASSKYCRTGAAWNGGAGALLALLSSNQPAVEPEGLLVEGAATNLILRSQALATAPWITAGATIATNGVATAPDGTLTGTSLEFQAGDAEGTKNWHQHVAATASTTYTFSVWLWTASGTLSLKLSRTNSLTWASASVSSVFVVTTTPTRYSLTFTTDGADTFNDCLIGSENKTPYLCDTGTVYAWGAQLETGTFPTSNITTAGTSATRAVDSIDALMSQTLGTSGLLRATVTPFWSGLDPTTYANYSLACAGASATSTLLYEPGDTSPATFVGSQYAHAGGSFVAGTPKRYSLAWINTAATIRNLTEGTSASTSFASSGTTGTDRLRFGGSGSLASFWLKDIAVFPR